ncbi:MAG: FKBP-type peptidyl-prolyl cis-trans isomerase [Vicinamibacteria bacterium]|nr:FKBP-type peptidyl-prolyl cis-trans isomerase [Vicinamibacteria bacterium]
MSRVILIGAVVAVFAMACQAGTPAKTGAAESKTAATRTLATDDEKAVYAIGAMLGKDVGEKTKGLLLSPAEIEILQAAMADAIAGRKLEVDPQTMGEKVIPPFVAARSAKAMVEEKERAKTYREKAAKEPGAVMMTSGLVIQTLTEGKGLSPKAQDTVRVHYQGTFVDGKEFDSSIKRGQPVEFKLAEVIPCWGEGVQQMKVGGKARLVCPSDIAYGDQGRPPVIPGGATLVFEVELLAIKGK